MEQAFLKLWVIYRDENGKQVDLNWYLKTMEDVQARIERVCAVHGDVAGHVSKYVDMGSCYLMDLEFGKDGFIDFEAKSVGVVITWNNETSK